MIVRRAILKAVMRVVASVGTASLGLFSSIGAARADDPRYGTREEARALVRRGIRHIETVGLDAALAAFADHNGPFVDRDLYLIVIDMTGRRLAHGANPRLVGRNITDAPDAASKTYGREILAGAERFGSGWADYIFADPLTGRQLPKTSYYERAGNLVLICGAYLRR